MERERESGFFQPHPNVFFVSYKMYIRVFRMRLRLSNDDTKYVNMIMERCKHFAIRIEGMV